MTHPLSRVPFVGQFVDERFLDHRRRSSSFAGMVAAVLAVALFEYRYFASHVWDWALFAVAVVFAILKMSMFAWYRIHD